MSTFIVEDGSGVEDANAYIEISDADEIISNYGDSSDWSSATQAQKENAIREATRYLDLHYIWDGYKVYEGILQWPRYEIYDEDDNYMAEDEIPDRILQAVSYLALKIMEGDTLLEDFQNEGEVKRTKDIVGPITEEREYVTGELPEKTYQVVDKLVAPFVIEKGFGETELERG